MLRKLFVLHHHQGSSLWSFLKSCWKRRRLKWSPSVRWVIKSKTSNCGLKYVWCMIQVWETKLRHFAPEIPEVIQVRLSRLSRWLKHKSSFVQSLQGMIRAAVGQGRQILAERFPQFRDLVSFASREVSLQFAGDCLGGKVCQWGRFAQGLGVWPTGFLGDDWYPGI